MEERKYGRHILFKIKIKKEWKYLKEGQTKQKNYCKEETIWRSGIVCKLWMLLLNKGD